MRAAIQASDEPASALAARFGTTGQTICTWKHRSTVHDRSLTQQDAIADDEGMAQTEAGTVQKTDLLPHGK